MGKGLVSERHDRSQLRTSEKNAVAQLEGIMTKEVKGCLDWVHSKDNQGTWLKKTMVSLWFKMGTRNGRIIESLKRWRKDITDRDHKVNGERVRCILEVSSLRNPSMLPKGMSKDLSQVVGTIQVTMYAKIGEQRQSEVAVMLVLEGEGISIGGWTVFPWILNQICTRFDAVLLDTLVKDF